MDVVTAIHTLATLAFVAGSAIVSVRLLRLASRTRQLPELLLGGSIGCTAVLGYGLLIGVAIARGGEQSAEAVPTLAVALAALGQTIHGFGVVLFLAFVPFVFRRREPWAWALAGALSLLLVCGLATTAWQTGFRTSAVGSVGWFCEYAVIWMYPVWGGTESYLYYRKLRPRVALGLVAPLVLNRFLLWAVGSVFSVGAIWTASVPFAFMGNPELLAATTAPIRVATALFGLGSITCSLFTFLPPAFYRRMFEAREGAGDRAMEMA